MNSTSSTIESRVLIVEDDLTISGNLFSFLEARGFIPDAAYDGRAALTMLKEHHFDVVILDIGLPGVDGYKVLQTLREQYRSAVPVLILTARDSLDDKLAGFSHGADDYLSKPFALAEVQARLQALLNRSRGGVVDSIKAFGDLAFDTRSRVVTVKGKAVHLTRKSIQIVEIFLRQPGHVVSRDSLEANVWGNEPPSSDYLRSQMHLLRRALSDAGFDGIETVHGTGWRLVLSKESE